jgi:hypothetical protein
LFPITLTKEKGRLAFVRSKKVRGHTYYQLVRNYRDEGKHRQEVLAHLGHHDSLEAAILAEERKVADILPLYRDSLAYWQGRSASARISVKNNHYLHGPRGQPVEILDADEAYSRLEVLDEEYEEALRSGDSAEAWDRVYGSWESYLVIGSVHYHDANYEVEYYEMRISECQARLDRLLELMEEHPQPILSSRTFELLRRREAQRP